MCCRGLQGRGDLDGGFWSRGPQGYSGFLPAECQPVLVLPHSMAAGRLCLSCQICTELPRFCPSCTGCQWALSPTICMMSGLPALRKGLCVLCASSTWCRRPSPLRLPVTHQVTQSEPQRHPLWCCSGGAMALGFPLGLMGTGRLCVVPAETPVCIPGSLPCHLVSEIPAEHPGHGEGAKCGV